MDSSVCVEKLARLGMEFYVSSGIAQVRSCRGRKEVKWLRISE